MPTILIEFDHICQPELHLEYELDTMSDHVRPYDHEKGACEYSQKSKSCRICYNNLFEHVNTFSDPLEKEFARLATRHFAKSHGLDIGVLGQAPLEKVEIHWFSGGTYSTTRQTSLLGMDNNSLHHQFKMIPLRNFLDIIRIQYKSPQRIHPISPPPPLFRPLTDTQVAPSPKVTYPGPGKGITSKSGLSQQLNDSPRQGKQNNSCRSPKLGDVYMSDLPPTPAPPDIKPFRDHVHFPTNGAYRTGIAGDRFPLVMRTKLEVSHSGTGRKASSTTGPFFAHPAASNPFRDGPPKTKPQAASDVSSVHNPYKASHQSSGELASNHHVPPFGNSQSIQHFQRSFRVPESLGNKEGIFRAFDGADQLPRCRAEDVAYPRLISDD
ncbi:hypothetical protein E8E14_003587 [Neopestalotiopsis sp. 37M]|nr:hypothetical protein E8E14_003587 [Neopestalotiopsis sp. 37M]